MQKYNDISIDDHLKNIPSAVLPIVESARDVVRAVAPDAEEVVYQSRRPHSPSAMWKLAHYRLAGAYVVGIGTFPKHSSLFFYRGRELHDSGGLLRGGGKDSLFVTLDSPSDAETLAVEHLVREAFEMERATAPAR
jgi:hypothetical protein